MSRDVVLQQLDERSAAYQAEAERLRAEAERIAGLLAVCEAAAVPDRPALPTPCTGSTEVRAMGQDAGEVTPAVWTL
ncbi:hypothetical protein [Streptomyces asiaticus]